MFYKQKKPMSNIDQLKEAVRISPDNIPLRMHLAETLVQEKDYQGAVDEFKQVLERSYGHQLASLGMAKCYYHLGQYSAALVIYEQFEGDIDGEDGVFFARVLAKENNLVKAAEVYQNATMFKPNLVDPELEELLKIPAAGEWDPFDDIEDEEYWEWIVEEPDIDFERVGGMDNIKKAIDLKIIKPLQHPELYKAYGKKSGGGILLYGPPGCGKTYLARATAGQISARFINIGLHQILDMWIGNSEKNLHEVFELARKISPCVLFIDEVDALGASRSDLKQSAMRHTINQFLAEMDGINSSNEGILILAATNAPWNVDSAFRRPGRFDKVLFVPPPDEAGRIAILEQKLMDVNHTDIDCRKVAAAIPEFSGADINAVLEQATDAKLEEALAAGKVLPITTKDLLAAAKKLRPTTQEWFATARNYALYSNEGGQYNDILDYMNRKK